MKSYPFTSEVTYDPQGLPLYDRAVDSEFLRAVFKQYFSDGVFYNPSSALQVIADTGMQVKVHPGCCHIQGAMGIETEQRTLQVQAAEAQDRIDTVVARFDLSRDARKIDLYVVKGMAAESPQPPSLTRDTTIWELGLANLFIVKTTTDIPTQRITDTRLDTARCGQVIAPTAPADLEPYFAQLQASITTHDTEAQAQITELERVIRDIEADSEVMLKTVYDPRGIEGDAFARHYTCATTAAGWVTQDDGSYAQAVAAAGVTASSVLSSAIVGVNSGSLTLAQKQAIAEGLGYISELVPGAGSITFVCYDSVPEVDMTVQVTEVR